MEIDLRFLANRGEYERIEVGDEIAIILWVSGEIGFEHYCSGLGGKSEEPLARFLVAPTWPGRVVAKNPLTLRPSLLCLGAANPCGRHGFVENGVWREV